MTKDQRAYANSRVNSIFEQKKEELKRKHTTQATKLSDEEIMDLVLEGKVEFGEVSRLRNYAKHDARISFDLPEGLETDDEFDKETYEAELEPIRQEVEKVRDQLFLGDSERALELIKSLEKML